MRAYALKMWKVDTKIEIDDSFLVLLKILKWKYRLSIKYYFMDAIQKKVYKGYQKCPYMGLNKLQLD